MNGVYIVDLDDQKQEPTLLNIRPKDGHWRRLFDLVIDEDDHIKLGTTIGWPERLGLKGYA
jgi:hypothetical protein